MKKFLLALALLWSVSASAQNPTCPTRPVGDSTNACASTAFVQQNIVSNGVSSIAGVNGAILLSPGLSMVSQTLTVTFPNTRTKILTPTTLYYRTDGNDSTCNGLFDATYNVGSNPINCAALTAQGCDNLASAYDFNNLSITCKTTQSGVIWTDCTTINPKVGGGNFSFVGNPTPGSTVVTTSTCGSPFFLNNVGQTTVVLDQMDLNTTNSTQALVNVANRSTFVPGNSLRFGSAVFAHVNVHDALAQFIAVSSSYKIIGSAPYHVQCNMGFIFIESVTVTVTGALGFSAFLNLQNGCKAQLSNGFFGFSGVTGNAYSLSLGATLNFLGTGGSISDGSFVGNGTGIQMTASGISGVIRLQDTLAGTGVPAGTKVISQLSGTPGGNGIYLTDQATSSAGVAVTSTGGGCSSTVYLPGNAAGTIQTGAICQN